MRKYVVLGAILIAAIIAIQEFNTTLRLHERAPSSQAERIYDSASIPAIPFPNSTSTPVAEKTKITGSTALEVAKNYLEAHRQEWNLQSYHDFRPVEFHTPLGSKVKFSVYQGEVPVVDMGIQIEIGRDLSVLAVQNGYQPIAKADFSERRLNADQILQKNSDRYDAEGPVKLSQPVLFVRPGSREGELAYLVPVHDKAEAHRALQILFRASDGQVLTKAFSRSEF
jgi:hypothetical protein